MFALAPAMVLSTTNAIIAAVIVVVILFLVWKFVKFAFKIALVVGVAILLYIVLNKLGVL